MHRRAFLTGIAGALATAAAPLARRASPLPWKAGVATVDITPGASIWMAGFAARKLPSQGVEQPLHAKALALDDGRGARAVLVTADLLGLTGRLAARIAGAAKTRYRLPRASLMLNASHTHCGPVTDGMLAIAYDLTDAQRAAIDAYTRELEAKIVSVIGTALKRLRPASLHHGEGTATFAANRRTQFTPVGPVDHAVPVLRVDTEAGARLAIVFGYACHNTTLPAEMVKFHGDYAGVAQAALEQRHAGTTAMFVAGCGADANPKPRGTLALVEQHGTALADAVDGALPSLQPVSGPLRAAFGTVDLPFAAPLAPEEWRQRFGIDDQYVQRYVRATQEARERGGGPITVQPDPIQVWRFGDGRGLTLVAMGGEVVVDYSLRLKREYAGQRVWAAGYSNDVFGYVPSVRVLKEGGYEAGGAMIYYGRPGPFTEAVEELIFGKVRELMGNTS